MKRIVAGGEGIAPLTGQRSVDLPGDSPQTQDFSVVPAPHRDAAVLRGHPARWAADAAGRLGEEAERSVAAGEGAPCAASPEVLHVALPYAAHVPASERRVAHALPGACLALASPGEAAPEPIGFPGGGTSRAFRGAARAPAGKMPDATAHSCVPRRPVLPDRPGNSGALPPAGERCRAARRAAQRPPATVTLCPGAAFRAFPCVADVPAA